MQINVKLVQDDEEKLFICRESECVILRFRNKATTHYKAVKLAIEKNECKRLDSK